jgi:hypothetical protein
MRDEKQKAKRETRKAKNKKQKAKSEKRDGLSFLKIHNITCEANIVFCANACANAKATPKKSR